VKFSRLTESLGFGLGILYVPRQRANVARDERNPQVRRAEGAAAPQRAERSGVRGGESAEDFRSIAQLSGVRPARAQRAPQASVKRAQGRASRAAAPRQLRNGIARHVTRVRAKRAAA
jgi:hypothetical protein